MRRPSSSWCSIHESTEPSGSEESRSSTSPIAACSAAAASSAGACFAGSPSKFASPGIRPSFQLRMSCHGTSSSPSMKQSERTLIGSAYSRNRSASPRSTSPSSSSSASRGIIPWVRPRRRGAERHLGDRPDPPLLRPFHAEHVLAHRAVQRRGLGRGGERLGVAGDALHVVVAGDEPEADGRHEAHGFLVAQACVGRVWVALERLQGDRLADRHRNPRSPSRPLAGTGILCPNDRTAQTSVPADTVHT